MREGSTLIPELLPDTAGCILEQPLALPEGSHREAAYRVAVLVGVTLGFDLFLGNLPVAIFVMLISLRLLRYSAGLVIMLVVHRNIPPVVITLVAAGLLLHLSATFTKHWTFLTTATGGPTARLERRRRVMRILPWQVALFPLAALWGAGHLIARRREVRRAWESYLCYGQDGVRAPGAFHSPAGDFSSRLRLFYTTGGAVSLSFLVAPLPICEIARPELALAMSLLVAVPTLICLLVPALVLAPHLSRPRGWRP